MIRDAIDALFDQVADLQRQIGALKHRIEQLEHSPFNPYSVPIGMTFTTPSCPACGLKMDKPLGYVCTRGDCPTGLCGPQC